MSRVFFSFLSLTQDYISCVQGATRIGWQKKKKKTKNYFLNEKKRNVDRHRNDKWQGWDLNPRHLSMTRKINLAASPGKERAGHKLEADSVQVHLNRAPWTTRPPCRLDRRCFLFYTFSCLTGDDGVSARLQEVRLCMYVCMCLTN